MKLYGKVWVAGALFAVCLSTGVSAMELKGVRMPDQITVAGQPLVLNGMGLRGATISRINVYVAGLYLTNVPELSHLPHQPRFRIDSTCTILGRFDRIIWRDTWVPER